MTSLLSTFWSRLTNSTWAPADTTARRLLLGLLAAPLLLAGCETAVDVPEPAHTPRVALLLTLDNLRWDDSLRRQDFVGRRPFVSVSQRLYDQNPLTGRADATVEVRDAGGQVVERYRPVAPAGNFEAGRYRPTLRYEFRPGQQYAVRVTVPGVEPAESQLVLPTEVPVQATVTPLPSNTGQSRARVTVTFDDPAGAADYYLATARLVDAQGQAQGFLNVEDEDTPTVSSYRLSDPSSNYNLYPFSDANLNGQQVSFSTVVSYFNGVPGAPPLYLEVTLVHLTRDLYLFFNSYAEYNNNHGNPFAEPAPLHSNLTPGFGVFGGAADASVRLPL
jgi:hypothetical protein